jgi:hypothetical protein
VELAHFNTASKDLFLKRKLELITRLIRNYHTNHYSIYLCLYSPCGSWPLFQFINLDTVGRNPWTGDQPVARPLFTEQHKHRINAHRHPFFEWDSNPRSSVRAREDSSCLRPRGHCERQSLLY